MDSAENHCNKLNELSPLIKQSVSLSLFLLEEKTQMVQKMEIEFSEALVLIIDKAFAKMQEDADENSSAPWIISKTDFVRYVVMKGCQRLLRGQKL